MNKVMGTDQARALVLNGATVAIEGFVGNGHPDELTRAMEQRFTTRSSPQSDPGLRGR